MTVDGFAYGNSIQNTVSVKRFMSILENDPPVSIVPTVGSLDEAFDLIIHSFLEWFTGIMTANKMMVIVRLAS